MTANQIEYAKLQETKRHNLVYEQETNRHNVQTESIGWFEVYEVKRHNVATETETKRHNVATENETNRHNVVTEQIGWSQAAASHRQAAAAESQAAAAHRQASVAEFNAATNRYLAENTVRQTDYSNFTQRINARASEKQATAASMNALSNAFQTPSKIQANKASAHMSYEKGDYYSNKTGLGWAQLGLNLLKGDWL